MKIKLIKDVVVKACTGEVLNVYKTGHVFDVTYEFYCFYVVKVGPGIYKDECEVVLQS